MRLNMKSKLSSDRFGGRKKERRFPRNAGNAALFFYSCRLAPINIITKRINSSSDSKAAAT